MNGILEVIIAIAVIGYLLARRVLGEPAEGRRMLLIPAILTVIGLVQTTDVSQSGLSLGFLAATTVVSVLIGVLRGASVRVFERDGLVFMKYTAVSVGLLVANVLIRLGAGLLLGVVDPSASASVSTGVLLALGASLLAEGLVVLFKAVGTSGRIVWAKGRRGAPHQTSAFLDGLQEHARDRFDVATRPAAPGSQTTPLSWGRYDRADEHPTRARTGHHCDVPAHDHPDRDRRGSRGRRRGRDHSGRRVR
ncbi:DUF1453 domain-containing protein [Williamsia phyllosphaerae]|uniref:DUF1453 domain-containing protein n=1 Tax=Williamsia phyllosphaerae TaxID=885042 RepID=A0ABQ1U589_9NOCA|nr:DUF1453 domain-containing protein [Williamsia phyllosphaerae]GGF09829.1 hypothetical protein GCM10007298_02220 [Williamsia phyllosphaerae]